MVGSERHVCNATESIIDVQGHFRVIQGRWFWYQTKACMRYPILVINSNLKPILYRFRDTGVYWLKNRQNCQFVPTPVSEIALVRGDPFRISWWARYFQNDQALWRWRSHDACFLRFDTIPECDGRTDRQTDRQTDGHSSSGYTSACIVRYANALVKIVRLNKN